MTDVAGSALADRGLAGAAARARALFADPRRIFARALALEMAERRIFLWIPVAAGAGAVCYTLIHR